MSVQVKKKQAVLLVDDEEDIRKPIVNFLKKDNPDLMVVEAGNGSEAVQKINNQEFSCIVTDLNMPRLSGQELIKSVKGSRFNKNTPIIVLSAHPDPTLYDDYDYLLLLEKPIGITDLTNHIKTQLILGPLSSRVSTFVLKVFTDTVVKKLEALGVQPSVVSTNVVKANVELPSKYNIGIRINNDEDYNSIILGIDEQFISSVTKDVKDEIVPVDFAIKFAKKVASDLLMNAKKPSVSKSSLDSFRNLGDMEPIKLASVLGKQRITVKIDVNGASLYCHALSGSPKFA